MSRKLPTFRAGNRLCRRRTVSSAATPLHRREPATELARAVYEQYDTALHRFLMRRSGANAHAAHDLAQEVYLRLLRVEDPELLRNPQGYMYRVASHVVYEHLLRQEAEPVTYSTRRVEELDEHPPELPFEGIEKQLTAHRELEEILEQLPPVHRAAFVLFKRDGFSYREVAEKLDLSVHTVKKYLCQAFAQLRTLRLQHSPGGRSIP